MFLSESLHCFELCFVRLARSRKAPYANLVYIYRVQAWTEPSVAAAAPGPAAGAQSLQQLQPPGTKSTQSPQQLQQSLQQLQLPRGTGGLRSYSDSPGPPTQSPPGGCHGQAPSSPSPTGVTDLAAGSQPSPTHIAATAGSGSGPVQLAGEPRSAFINAMTHVAAGNGKCAPTRSAAGRVSPSRHLNEVRCMHYA
jgi:hypothetical protein